MNKQIVIFVTTPLIKRDIKLYGVEFYQSHNITVWFINLWPLFSKRLDHKADIEYENQIHIGSIIELIKVLSKFRNEGSVFLSDVSYNENTFILYLVLTLLNIDYSYVDNWYSFLHIKNEKKIYTILKKITRPIIFPVRQLKSLIFYVFLTKPNIIFASSKKSYNKNTMIGKKSIIIPYASFDYDDYISDTDCNESDRLVSGEYFVFLDQSLTNIPDFARAGIKSPLTDNYYSSLNNLFSAIEDRFSLKSVVAYHPRRLESNANEIIASDAYFYKTYPLIKNAKFILAHYSTAINWAVLLRKPIIFIKTNEMIGTFIEHYIDRYSAELGLSTCNIDDSDFKLKESDFNIDNSTYEDFQLNHIVFESGIKRKTYEIIFHALFPA